VDELENRAASKEVSGPSAWRHKPDVGLEAGEREIGLLIMVWLSINH
jgi:hypothetical protein